VDELDGYGAEKILAGGLPGPGGGRGQGQDRPQPLAARSQQVGGDVVEEAVAGHHRLDEQGLEPLELIFESGKPEELYNVHFLQTIGADADD
jgi:hypothetical protein